MTDLKNMELLSNFARLASIKSGEKLSGGAQLPQRVEKQRCLILSPTPGVSAKSHL
jgi:hypothetical protein